MPHMNGQGGTNDKFVFGARRAMASYLNRTGYFRMNNSWYAWVTQRAEKASACSTCRPRSTTARGLCAPGANAPGVLAAPPSRLRSATHSGRAAEQTRAAWAAAVRPWGLAELADSAAFNTPRWRAARGRSRLLTIAPGAHPNASRPAATRMPPPPRSANARGRRRSLVAWPAVPRGS